jgi:hypothetical protein
MSGWIAFTYLLIGIIWFLMWSHFNRYNSNPVWWQAVVCIVLWPIQGTFYILSPLLVEIRNKVKS